MIAPAQALPQIRMTSGEMVPLTKRWLVASLHAAATHQNNSLWWARQVAGTVLHFLSAEDRPPCLPITEIENVVGQVLTHLSPGANSPFSMLPPPPEISLPALAQEVGAGWELGFMPALSERIHREASKGSDDLYLFGLRECVKHLCGTRRWKVACRHLEQEILEHASHALAKVIGTSGTRNLWVT